MHDPSVINTLGHSCNWFHLFNTEVLGSWPMRAVPISWLALPGKDMAPLTFISLNPAASIISCPVILISSCIAFSLSLNSQPLLIVGLSHVSFLFFSHVTR